MEFVGVLRKSRLVLGFKGEGWWRRKIVSLALNVLIMKVNQLKWEGKVYRESTCLYISTDVFVDFRRVSNLQAKRFHHPRICSSRLLIVMVKKTRYSIY